MMKKISYGVVVVLILFGLKAKGQISTDELPISFGFEKSVSKSDQKTIKSLPAIDMEKIRKEDAEDENNGFPPRFGYRHKTDFNLENSGTWTTLPNGDKIWQLDISCPGALSINLLYDKFWMPEQAKYFIYNRNNGHSIGAFTSVNNKGNKENPQGFATGLVYGDKITLEYYLPKGVEEQGIISVAYVVHGYRYINLSGSTKGQGEEANHCMVNINCCEGKDWQREKNAVALILIDGYKFCTGALINNTANDYRPLFLTANHCLENKHDARSNPNLNNWSFYWHYECPECTNNYNFSYSSTTGAIVLANNPNTDFALFELTEDPKYKTGVIPYYLGWDRSEDVGRGGGGIHHPKGDVKKISTHNMIPQKSNCFDVMQSGTFLNNNHFWKVNWVATPNGHSVDEGGSSGSPLLNNNHHVVGQLVGSGRLPCSSAACGNPSIHVTNYGKLSVSWYGHDGNIWKDRRLHDWLDPRSTNATVLDGTFTCLVTELLTDQTITTNTTVTACEISVRNVTVQNNAKLTLVPVGAISINPSFEVTLGSQLEIGASAKIDECDEIGGGLNGGTAGIGTIQGNPEGTWVLHKIEGELVYEDLLEMSPPTPRWYSLTIEGNQLFGKSSCSTFLGNLTGENSTHVFTNLISTLKACFSPLIQGVEKQYVSRVQNATQMVISGDTMWLLIDNEIVLEFYRQAEE